MLTITWQMNPLLSGNTSTIELLDHELQCEVSDATKTLESFRF